MNYFFKASFEYILLQDLTMCFSNLLELIMCELLSFILESIFHFYNDPHVILSIFLCFSTTEEHSQCQNIGIWGYMYTYLCCLKFWAFLLHAADPVGVCIVQPAIWNNSVNVTDALLYPWLYEGMGESTAQGLCFVSWDLFLSLSVPLQQNQRGNWSKLLWKLNILKFWVFSSHI